MFDEISEFQAQNKYDNDAHAKFLAKTHTNDLKLSPSLLNQTINEKELIESFSLTLSVHYRNLIEIYIDLGLNNEEFLLNIQKIFKSLVNSLLNNSKIFFKGGLHDVKAFIYFNLEKKINSYQEDVVSLINELGGIISIKNIIEKLSETKSSMVIFD